MSAGNDVMLWTLCGGCLVFALGMTSAILGKRERQKRLRQIFEEMWNTSPWAEHDVNSELGDLGWKLFLMGFEAAVRKPEETVKPKGGE